MQALEEKSAITTQIPTPPALAWEDLAAMPTLDAAVLQVAAIYDFRCHPYLIWMQSHSTSRGGGVGTDTVAGGTAPPGG